MTIVAGIAVVFGGLVTTLALIPVQDRTQLVLVGYPTVTSLLFGVFNYAKSHSVQTAMNELNDSVTNGGMDSRMQTATRAAVKNAFDDRDRESS